MIALALVGIALAPVVMPVLPLAIYGQQLADRFGRDAMTATVARVFHNLPTDEQARACMLMENYGEAGAIDLSGPGN